LANKTRLRIEEFILKEYRLPKEGTTKDDIDDYILKIVTKINRKVDTEKAIELAEVNGKTELLDSAFRWKAEINKANFNDEAMSLFSECITETPAKPAITIELKKGE
jgi:hypothetical protein